jgi:hypothetical protein
MTTQTICPNLQLLRDWYLDKLILNDDNGARDVCLMGNKMITQTPQECIPIPSRNPKFVNPEFYLSASQQEQMRNDEIRAKQIRKADFNQLNSWRNIPGMVGIRYSRIESYLAKLTTGDFLLSRIEFIAMKAAQSFVSSNINQSSQAERG